MLRISLRQPRLIPGGGATLRIGQRLTLVALLVGMCSLGWGADPQAREPLSVNVSVFDEKDQPVAEATVEVRRADQSLGKATSDSTGKAILSFPQAGTYVLSISKPGYVGTVTTLDVTQTSTGQDVDVVISGASLAQQSVEVTGEPSNPVTQVDATAGQTNLPVAQAKTAPSRPATLNDVLPLVPGIVRGPDGTARIAGFGEDHSALLINSVDVTDPATGGFGLSVPIDSVENVQVSVMPYLAEYGKFTAGVVAAETRRGGDTWDYSLNDPFPDFRIRSGHMEGVTDAAPRFNISGPLISNRLYFLEGAEYLFNKPEVITLPYPENLTSSQAFNSFTQLDAILNSKQTLTFSYHFAPHSIDYAGLSYFNPQPVTPDATFHESTATIVHRWAIGDGLLKSTLAGTGVSSGISPQGEADMVLTPGQNQGNYFGQQKRNATRYQWLEEWSPRAWHFAGDHSFKIGSVLAHSENSGLFQANPVLVQNSIGKAVERIDFTGGQTYGVADTEPAFYAQDHWMLNSQLAVDVGLRVEGQTITSTTRAAPRTGFVWSPMGSGNTVVRGGIGVFYDSVPLDIYAFNSYPEQVITTYNPDGSPVGPPVHYLNITGEAAQSEFPFIDRKTKSGNFAPYSTAWNVEMERAIGRWLMVRLKYLESHAQDMITLQPQVIQNQNAFVLGSSGWAQTRQADVTARIGAEGTHQFYFSYVRQYAYGDVNTASNYLGNFPFPVVQQNLIGSLPSEIPNRFLLWGNYALPKKILVTPHVELRNGFPYYPANLYQQWVDFTGPQYRYPRYFSLDMRVAKEFAVGNKHAVRLALTVRNLTDHFNPLEVYSNMANAQFGTFFGSYYRKVFFDFDFLR